MPKHYPLPVIVGTDLTGLLISIALSRAKSSHMLIGDPPGDGLPRSGQILTPIGTMVLTKHFPELAHLAHPKQSRVVCAGSYSLTLDFSHPYMLAIAPVSGWLAATRFRMPWNLDRVAADKALFERAENSPFCTHCSTPAAGVDYDPATDRIRSLRLEDGERVQTSHLFDATGYARFIGRQIDLPCRTLGAPQATVHAVYQAEDGVVTLERLTDVNWYQRTASVVRIYRSRHGVDGFAVCVPLGDKVAIHANTNAGSSGVEEDTLLGIAQMALNECGIHYQDYFPVLIQQGSDEREQYVHARAYGGNWLLTGSAYANTLVTIGTCVDTSFAAHHAATNFLKASRDIGKLYQGYMDYYLIMQEVWHWVTTHKPAESTESRVRQYAARYTWANHAQYFQSLKLQHYHHPLTPAFEIGRQTVGHTFFSEKVAPYCKIQKCGPATENQGR